MCLTLKSFTVAACSASHVNTVFLSLVSTFLTPWAPQITSLSHHHHHHYSSQKKSPTIPHCWIPFFSAPTYPCSTFYSTRLIQQGFSLGRWSCFDGGNGCFVCSFGLVGSQIIWFLIFCSWPCLVRENCRILQLLQILLELVMLKNHCFGKLSAHKWKSYQIGRMVAAIKPSIIGASSIQNPFILPAVTQWARTSKKSK